MKYRIYYSTINFPTGRREQHDVTLDINDPTELIPKLERHHGVDIEGALVIDGITKPKNDYRVVVNYSARFIYDIEAHNAHEAKEIAYDNVEAEFRADSALDLGTCNTLIEQQEDDS